MPRTPCRIDELLCGHSCTAYCRDDEHCELAYSSSSDLALVRKAFITPAKGVPFPDRIEPAPEALPWEQLPEQVKDRYCPAEAAHWYPYLEYFTGCPVPCPQSGEHQGQEEESDG